MDISNLDDFRDEFEAEKAAREAADKVAKEAERAERDAKYQAEIAAERAAFTARITPHLTAIATAVTALGYPTEVSGDDLVVEGKNLGWMFRIERHVQRSGSGYWSRSKPTGRLTARLESYSHGPARVQGYGFRSRHMRDQERAKGWTSSEKTGKFNYDRIADAIAEMRRRVRADQVREATAQVASDIRAENARGVDLFRKEHLEGVTTITVAPTTNPSRPVRVAVGIDLTYAQALALTNLIKEAIVTLQTE